METKFMYFFSKCDEHGNVMDEPDFILLNEEEYKRATGHSPNWDVMRLVVPKSWR